EVGPGPSLTEPAHGQLTGGGCGEVVDVLGVAVRPGPGPVRPANVDLETLLGQCLHPAGSPLHHGDRVLEAGVEIEGVDLVQGGEAVGVHVDEVRAVTE